MRYVLAKSLDAAWEQVKVLIYFKTAEEALQARERFGPGCQLKVFAVGIMAV